MNETTAQDLENITKNAILTRKINKYIDTFLTEAKVLAEKGEGSHSITIMNSNSRDLIVETLESKGFQLTEECVSTTKTSIGLEYNETTLTFKWWSDFPPSWD